MIVDIEKGIPIPSNGLKARSKYPWSTMEIGDSFVGPKSLTGQAHHRGLLTGMKYVTRTEGDKVRVWRTL
jgi:hypothetical protein